MRTIALSFAVVTLAYAAIAPVQAGGPAKVVYKRDIKPILQARCVRCHTQQDPSGGLALDTHAAITKGGRSGRLYTPGKGSKSLLVQRLRGQGGPRMPKGSPPLSAAQIKLFQQWIDQGAKF